MKDSESGQRWFVEPVAGELKGFPNSVLWVDYQDDERWDQYASRVRRMCQEAGVIHGCFQLGIRVDENDSRRQVRPCTCRIDQVPKSWTFDEVEELLTALAFTEIEVVAKEWRRHCTSWLVKAKYPSPETLLQPVIAIPGGPNIELCVTKEAKRRQVQTRSAKLKPETRINFPHLPVQAHAPKRPSRAEEEEVDDEFIADEQMEAENLKKQKLTGAIPKSAAKPSQRKYQPWMPKGGERRANDGLGDCLFHSIQQSVARLEPQSRRSARQLRAFTVAFMKRHKDEYESLWDGHAPGRGAKDGNEDDSWHGTFEDYLEQIQKQGCWATYLECFALSAALYRTILILNDWGEVWHFGQEGNDDAICLFYQEHIGHYEFLDGPVEAELRHWSVQHAGAKGARAAGRGGRSQPSPKSLRLSDFGTPNSKISAHSPTAKAKQPASIRLSEFSSKPSRSLRLSNFASSKCKSVQRSIFKAKSNKADEPKFQWKCEGCGVVVGADSSKQLGNNRANHIARSHPNVPRHKFRNLRDAYVEITNVPLALRVWTCSYCGKGIANHVKRETAWNAARKHVKLCGGKRANMKQNRKRILQSGQSLNQLGFALVKYSAQRRLLIDSYTRNNPQGHDLVELRCPTIGQIRAKSRRFSRLTCRLCTSLFHIPSAIGKQPCPVKVSPKRHPELSSRRTKILRKARWWAQLRQKWPTAVTACIDAWRLNRVEVQALEKQAREKHTKGWQAVTPLTKCRWYRSLVEDGDVEPNPGPNGHLLQKLLIGFCNCGGHDAAYQALAAMIPSKPHVIGLAEICASPWQGKKLRERLEADGYRTWLACTPPKISARGHSYCVGGILVAIRQDVKGHAVEQFLHEDGESIHVDLESFVVSIGWRRPSTDNAGNWMEDIAQSCLHATAREVPWLGIADWNLTPDQNPLAAGGAGLCAVRDHRSELIPSRWNSTRCIDYAVSNLSNINDLQASFAPDRVSDHKILYFRGKLKVSTEVGRLLQPTQDCSKPPGVSQAEWRKALEEEWEAVIPPLALAGGADEEWQSFNRAAERCALRARARFQHPLNRGTIYRPKGSQPQLMKVGSHVKFKQAEGTFRQRSLAKFVGRLTEAIKQQPRVDQKLLVALNRTWPEQIPHDVSWDNALATAQKLLATEKGRLRPKQ